MRRNENQKVEGCSEGCTRALGGFGAWWGVSLYAAWRMSWLGTCV